MKSLVQHIKEEFNFRINSNNAKNHYSPKTKDELKQIIQDHYANDIYNLNDIDVSQITDFGKLFFNDENIDNPEFDISRWNVSNGITFRLMFYKCKKFNSDLSNWDVSNGKYFSGMFEECENFNSDLSRWNVSNGINFKFMFSECNNFNCDLSNWDVSNGKEFGFMFDGCNKFNSDLSQWDVSKGVDFSDMFTNCPIKQEFKPKHKDIE